MRLIIEIDICSVTLLAKWDIQYSFDLSVPNPTKGMQRHTWFVYICRCRNHRWNALVIIQNFKNSVCLIVLFHLLILVLFNGVQSDKLSCKKLLKFSAIQLHFYLKGIIGKILRFCLSVFEKFVNLSLHKYLIFLFSHTSRIKRYLGTTIWSSSSSRRDP